MSSRALLAVVLILMSGACFDTEPDYEEEDPKVRTTLRSSMMEDTPATLSLTKGLTDSEDDLLVVEFNSLITTPPVLRDLWVSRGEVDIIPPLDFNGPLILEYTVSGIGIPNTRVRHTVDVAPVNDPPVANSGTMRIRSTSAVLLGAFDVDGDPLSYSVEPVSSGLLYGQAPNLTYAPFAGFFGNDTIRFIVSDGKVQASGEVIMEVNRGVAPIANSITIGATEDTERTFTLTASDADFDSLTFVVEQGPANGTLRGTPPDLTYTPNLNFTGSDQVRFRARDAYLDSTEATVTILVTNVNDPPVGAPQSRTLQEDQPLVLALQGSDPDPQVLQYEVSSPAHGTLTGAGATYTYTPAANYHGPDAFTYRVFDGVVRSEAYTISLQVNSVPDAPVAESFALALNEDASLAVALRGRDGDGDALTYTLVSVPSHGTLSGEAPSLLYTPAANYFGPDAITYTVTAGGETSTVGTVTLNVRSVNDPPVAQDGTATTLEDQPVTIALVASDIDSPTLNYSITASPANGTLSGNGASRLFTPNANFHGSTSFTFQVSDGLTGGTDTGTISIQIAAVNDAPVVVADFAMTETDTAIELELLSNDSDPENDALTIDSFSPPAHGTATLDGDTLIYTPAVGFVGVESLSYTAVDAHGASSTGQLRLGVGTVPPGMPAETIATTGSNSAAPSLSDDGRYIAFSSAFSLLPADTNNAIDVYLHDRVLRRTTLVSKSADGIVGNGVSIDARISGNGRYIAFHSLATNLLAGTVPGGIDVYRYDRVTDEMIRVNVSPSGAQVAGISAAPEISDDGNKIAFESNSFELVPNDFNGAYDVFVRDIAAGTTTRVSVTSSGGESDGESRGAAISGNGQVVAFFSLATNLVEGDSNGVMDVFVHDSATGSVSRVTVSSTGTQANNSSSSASLSRDGRFVSFLSNATNLVSPAPTSRTAFVRDRQAQTTTRSPEGSVAFAHLSDDGRYLSLRTTLTFNIVVRDRLAGSSAAGPVPGSSQPSSPVISGDGRYVAVNDSVTGAIVVLPNLH